MEKNFIWSNNFVYIFIFGDSIYPKKDILNIFLKDT